MAIIQSEWAKGKLLVPDSGCNGVVVAQLFEHTLTANVTAASDILELGILPAGNTVVDAVLISDDLGTVTLDVGIMSGEVGDTGTRTSGAELFDDAADGSTVRMSAATGFRIAPTDKHRSIGVKFSANITAASQKVSLLLLYKAVS